MGNSCFISSLYVHVFTYYDILWKNISNHEKHNVEDIYFYCVTVRYMYVYVIAFGSKKRSQ